MHIALKEEIEKINYRDELVYLEGKILDTLVSKSSERLEYYFWCFVSTVDKQFTRRQKYDAYKCLDMLLNSMLLLHNRQPWYRTALHDKLVNLERRIMILDFEEEIRKERLKPIEQQDLRLIQTRSMFILELEGKI